MANTITLTELLAKSPDEVADFLSGIYEHSPWVAKALTSKTPNYSQTIHTVSDLASSMKTIVDDASTEMKMALLNAHPDLCEKVTKLQELTKESQEEQSNAGLQSLTDEELEKFTSFNTTYRTKYSFPFILAVRNVTKYTVLAALEGRLSNPPEKEFTIAIDQVHKIAWMRILSKIN